MNKTTKKKAGILLLVAALLATGMQMDVTSTTETEKIAAATKTAEPSNTNSTNTLVISTTTELKSFADDVNAGNTYEGQTVKLANDIVFDGRTANNFTPIGETYSCRFEGTFDGCGHSIRGIVFEARDSNQGLFGYVNDGTVQNVILESSEIVSTNSDCGGIAGEVLDGKIDNCKVIGCKISGEDGIGGIVGRLVDSTVSNCVVTGTISANSEMRLLSGTGGIAGAAKDNNKIYNCCNYASISVGDCGGGILGSAMEHDTIQNCYNAGMLKETENATINSIVADGGNDAIVRNCYALEGTASKMGVTAMGNKVMTAAEMKSQAFLDNLNELAKSNGWVEWEMQSGYAYPVLKNTVVNAINTTAAPSVSPNATQATSATTKPTATPGAGSKNTSNKNSGAKIKICIAKSVKRGKKIKLKVTYDGVTALPMRWSVSNKKVAIVKKNKLVTRKKGTVKLTAIFKNCKKTVTIRVK